MEISIDLEGASTEQELFMRIDETLGWGGPLDEKEQHGWGFNWSALKDCLSLLEEGGIWGAGKKLKFPVKLVFKKTDALKTKCPQAYSNLREILEDTHDLYKRHNMVFTHSLPQ